MGIGEIGDWEEQGTVGSREIREQGDRGSGIGDQDRGSVIGDVGSGNEDRGSGIRDWWGLEKLGIGKSRELLGEGRSGSGCNFV